MISQEFPYVHIRMDISPKQLFDLANIWISTIHNIEFHDIALGVNYSREHRSYVPLSQTFRHGGIEQQSSLFKSTQFLTSKATPVCNVHCIKPIWAYNQTAVYSLLSWIFPIACDLLFLISEWYSVMIIKLLRFHRYNRSVAQYCLFYINAWHIVTYFWNYISAVTAACFGDTKLSHVMSLNVQLQLILLEAWRYLFNISFNPFFFWY